MTTTWRIVFPHGQPGTKFGLFQDTKDGSLRASSPCCGDLMEEADGECNFCGKSWDWLADQRSANTTSSFSFVPDDSDDILMNEIIATWIQRLLGFKEHSTDCKVKVDWK